MVSFETISGAMIITDLLVWWLKCSVLLPNLEKKIFYFVGIVDIIFFFSLKHWIVRYKKQNFQEDFGIIKKTEGKIVYTFYVLTHLV